VFDAYLFFDGFFQKSILKRIAKHLPEKRETEITIILDSLFIHALLPNSTYLAGLNKLVLCDRLACLLITAH
jgi:hypothetical protein